MKGKVEDRERNKRKEERKRNCERMKEQCCLPCVVSYATRERSAEGREGEEERNERRKVGRTVLWRPV